MKKYIALLLALATLFTLAACGKKNNNSGDTNTTGAPMVLPDNALALMNTVWAGYGENDKFPAMGGNYDEDESKNTVVDNAPGKYDLANDGMTATLMVPADRLGDIADAASLMHGMMANNFTWGTYQLKDGVDAKAFGDAMYKSITEQRFLCGAPEAIFVATVGDQYVLAAFGLKDLMDTLQNKVSAAYPGANVLYNQLIEG